MALYDHVQDDEDLVPWTFKFVFTPAITHILAKQNSVARIALTIKMPGVFSSVHSPALCGT